MKVGNLISTMFLTAISMQGDSWARWRDASHAAGKLLPNSMLPMSIQRIGELDAVLRCMEEESVGDAKDDDVGHYMFGLSEMWIGALYEVVRLINSNGIGSGSDEMRVLAHDLRMVRVPLEKHQIAQDSGKEPLTLQRELPRGDETDLHTYSPSDPRRAHIMPMGVSDRGSPMWQVIDLKANRSYWLERRTISDRFLALWDPQGSAAISLASPT